MEAFTFLFEAGNPALDLLNTRPISKGERRDYLTSPEALDAWLTASGLHPAGRVLEFAPRLREHLLVDARALREAVEAAVVALREGRAPPEDALGVVNGILSTVRYSDELEVVAGRYQRRRVPQPQDPSALLEPVAAAAVELLTEADPERIRQCDDDSCVLWFVDVTRNGSRRWCSMARCGNRAKAAAHYRRGKNSDDTTK